MNLYCMLLDHTFETRAPSENPHKHRESVQIPHRKDPGPSQDHHAVRHHPNRDISVIFSLVVMWLKIGSNEESGYPWHLISVSQIRGGALH